MQAVRDKIAAVESRIVETFSSPEKEDARDNTVRQRMIAERRGKVLDKEKLRKFLTLLLFVTAKLAVRRRQLRR